MIVSVENLDPETLEAFLKENVIALIGFWAAWCGPCKMMFPVLADLAAKYHEEYAVGRINVDDCPALAETYQIENLPTLLIMKHGEEVGRIVGYMNMNALNEEILKQMF